MYFVSVGIKQHTVVLLRKKCLCSSLFSSVLCQKNRTSGKYSGKYLFSTLDTSAAKQSRNYDVVLHIVD